MVEKVRFLLISLLSFAMLASSYAQDSPTNATHLLSLTEGISAPYRLAVNSEGTIYITDVNQKHIVKYDKDFNYSGFINVGSKPSAIAINSSDEVFVGDAKTGIIYKLDENENATVFSTLINSPSSMVFDSNNRLYIIDSRLKQVRVLDTDGKFLRSIGTKDFIYPTAITYDPKNDRIFVSEHGGLEGGYFGSPKVYIWIYDTDGNYLGKFGSTGTGDGQFMKIQGMAVSQFNTFFIVDQSLSSISIFEENTQYLNEFGEYGTVPGKLHTPMDVVFDYQGRTLVSSMGSGSVEVYYINQLNPTYEISAVNEIICPGGNTDIKVEFTGLGPWTFTYTKDGLNPVTVTDTDVNPYVFNVSETGLYEVNHMSDSRFGAADYSSKVQVSQNPFPTANLSGGDVEICNGTSTELTVNFTGMAPYRFRYTDGTTTSPYITSETDSYSIHADVDGAYQLTHLNGAGGCLAQDLSDVANVSINALPSSVMTCDNTEICEGSTTDIAIQLTGTAPWTLTYTVNGENPVTVSEIYDNPYVLTTPTGGLYTITALSDAFNTGECFTGSADIVVTPLPISNITNATTVCENTNINLELTGSAPWELTYTIDGNNPVTVTDIVSNTYEILAQEAGLYQLTTLSGNACNGTLLDGNNEVHVKSLPTSTFTAGSPIVFICEGDTKDLSLELQGEGPWNYTYTVDGLNPVSKVSDNSLDFISVAEPGTYKVVEVNDVNCLNTVTIGTPTISYKSAPTAKITSGDISICEGETTDIVIELTGLAPWSITYLKNGLNPTTVVTSSNPYLLPVSEAGTYNISHLSDASSVGSCYTGSATISIIEKPTARIGSGEISICEDESASIVVQLTGSAPWTFSYSVDDLNPTTVTTSQSSYMINTSQSGSYKLIAISDANCTGTSMDGLLTIHKSLLPNPNLGEDITICQGESTTLNAGEFHAYLWDDGSKSSTIAVNSTGIYNVEVTDINGCVNSDEVFISVKDLPVADFTYTVNDLQVSFLNSSQNASSYLWDFGDANTSLDLNPLHSYLSGGIYDVTLTASDELCGDNTIAKTINLVTTSMGDHELEENVKIYPNPSDGFITIELDQQNQSEFKVVITSIAGRTVYSKEYNANKTKIDLSNLQSGFYNLQLIAKEWTHSQNIILNH